MAIVNSDHGSSVRQAAGNASKKAPASWVETLRQSDEDIAAGRVVPVDDVLNELDDMIAGMDMSASLKP
jgi:predicted transcriptional regulator